MFEAIWAHCEATIRRVRRFERRELTEFRRWVEHTRNLVHLSVLVFVPLLIGVVTWLSNSVSVISFLLFPPLASGTYTLFADPEGKYSSPRRFIGGMSAGAICGWIAIEVSVILLYHVPPGEFQVRAGAAALGIFFTVLSTWALDLEEPTAFSTALLVLIGGSEATEAVVFGVPVSGTLVYVIGVAVSSTLVSAVFVLWRRHFYEQRAHFLYQSTKGDDHVLVPMRGEHAETTAMFAARLAAAHDAGKVVLLDVVDSAVVATAERELLTDRRSQPGELASIVGANDAAEPSEIEEPENLSRPEAERFAEGEAAEEAAARLERQARQIRTKVGVTCEVVVAVEDTARATTVLRTAEETNCDLIVVPFEERHGQLSEFVRSLFKGGIDVIAFRSMGERTRWKQILVPVRKAGDTAHTMIDFAERLVGYTGRISVCTCIDRERGRRRAESMLSDLVEAFSGQFETRVARTSIERFLEANASHYDLVIIGASTDRSAASRFVSPPTFERIHDVDCDVAVVDRG